MSKPQRVSAGSGPAQSLALEVNNGRIEAIGPFRVQGVLGRGGMGVVYDVRDERDGRLYALKTIETRFLELPESNAGRRFGHEVALLERLDHPGVVRLYECGFARNSLGYDLAFFVMERLVGKNLDQVLQARHALPAREAARIGADVFEALAYLDENRVLHRDIKPANLFLDEQERVVLMDFGLARSAEFTRLTRAGNVIGTMPYMPPEALRGKDIDIASDVYAVGVVLFEMLVGSQPFAARDPTLLVREIERGLVWPAEADFGPFDAPLKAAVATLLAFDARARPSPREAAAALRRVFGEERRPLANTASMFVGEAETQVPPPAPVISTTPRVATVAPVAPIVSSATPVSAPRSSTSAPVERFEKRSGPSWPAALGMAGGAAALFFALGAWWAQPPPSAPQAPVASAPPPVVVATPSVAVVAPPPPPVAPPPVAPPPPVEPDEPVFSKPQAAFRYGEQALKEGRFPAAIRALSRGLELNPAAAGAHRLLGDAYASVGERERAKDHYRTYLALRPSAPDANQVRLLLEK